MKPAFVEPLRIVLRWLIAAAFLVAGVLHIAAPRAFLTIVPDWVPFPRETVFVTGACEVAGAIALFVPRLRWWAGVMLAAYAVCVYPANVKHTMLHIEHGTPPGWWYHGPRLLFQPVIVWWALFAGAVIDWPFGRRR
jgi:uncharacterized membrane protein